MNIQKKFTGRASITLFGVILLLILGAFSFTIFKKKEYVSNFSGSPIVFYNLNNEVNEINFQEGEAQKLPSELVVKPGEENNIVELLFFYHLN